jgi:hypothetical protein
VADKEKRIIYPVIVTDRVVYADRSVREWNPNKPLVYMKVPRGFGGCERPIYIVADREEHLAALFGFGLALAHQAPVQKGDLELGLYEHAGLRADEAIRRNAEALTRIRDDFDKGLLEEDLACHLRDQLLAKAGHCDSLSTNWIYASLLYGPLALNPLRRFEKDIKKEFFGEESSSSSLDPKDRERARDYFRGLCSQTTKNPVDRPKDSLLIKPLTNKLLSTILPLILSDLPRSTVIRCDDIDPVSRAPKRDIRSNGNFSNEQTPRPFGAVPITSLCA